MLRLRSMARPDRACAIGLAALMMTTALTAVAPVPQAYAQSAPDTAERSFDIPAQPLTEALIQFGRQAGLQASADAALMQDLRSAPVRGTMTWRQALTALLSGTGLTWRLNGSMVALERISQEGPPGTIMLDPVMVEGQAGSPRQAEIGNLPPAYAGGQVARGGKLGILGNRDVMDTPFNQSSYTSQLIQDQQAGFMSDVLKNDPSIGIVFPTSTALDGFVVRGFFVNNTEVQFNGLAGVAPSFFNSMMSESIERVEVLKGPNALLNGMAPNGSVGSTINTVPKRAGDEPLVRLTPSYIMDSQFGGHADIGRRFGPSKAFGVRLNAVYRDGDTAIDHQSRESALATLALDFRGERVRLSTDLGYQYQDVEGARGTALIAANGAVPKAPDSSRNFFDRWEFSNPEVFYGMARGEFDILDNLTAFAAVGGSHREQQSIGTSRTITNASGDLAAGTVGSGRADKMIGISGEVGMRALFNSGAISHQATIGYSRLDREWRRGEGPSHAFPASNIYNPTYGAAPSSSLFPDPDDVRKSQDLVLKSVVIGDTLSVLEERVQFTLGARHQQIESDSFNTTTGAKVASYDESAVTPMVGLVLKPWQNVSLYGNYIEGLQQGQTAPATAANAGQVFPPFVTKQYEAGIKIDFGQIAATLAAYQIAMPSAFIDPATNIFSVDGEQRHRGVDFNVFGEVSEGLRLLGGVGYVNSELTKTTGGTNDGNTGVGAPEFRIVAGTEWDVPFVKGLTLSGRATYTSSAYLNVTNTFKVPDWTQLDIGARYRLERAQGKPIVIRANIDNVFDANHWVATSFGQLTVSDPLTFKLSASVDF
jgi:iron complex outermembrane receptor protein